MKNQKDTAVSKAVEKKVVKNKKPNIFKRIGIKFKEIFSELKKVTWPTFSTVLKQLGCVLGIVLVVLVIIMAMDFGLTKALDVMRGKGV